jgi:hypothetical protein
MSNKHAKTDIIFDIESLPSDIVTYVLLFLPVPSIFDVALTNESMNAIIKEEQFWKELYVRDYALMGVPENNFHTAYKNMDKVIIFGKPVEKAWTGFRLQDRPCSGTYDRYKWNEIPPIYRKFNGDYSWLLNKFEFAENKIEQTEELLTEMKVSLPEDLLTFLKSADLQNELYSPTGCDVHEDYIPCRSPSLVEFYRDSQGCVYWYLYVEHKKGQITRSAVISSTKWIYDIDYATGMINEVDLNGITFKWCGHSVESFLYRVHLENTIWGKCYRSDKKSKVMNQEETDYLHFYSSNRERIEEAHKIETEDW